MKRLVYSLLTFLTLSCGTGRILNTADTKSTETIVFGKLSLTSDRQLINEKILMHFNERLWGKFAVWVDNSGYFYLKLPLGTNYIALLEYREGIGFYKNVPDNYTSVNLTAPDKIYYVGDMTFDWSPSDKDKRNQGGAAGVIAESSKTGDKIPVTITESKSTIEYFRQKFPDNKKEIITELIKVSE
jgi:hypothetical protein